MLTWCAIALGLFVWGAHGAVPPSLGGAADATRRLWRLAALPAALLAAAAAIVDLSAHPDAALAAGLGPGLPTGWPARSAILLMSFAILGDVAGLLRAPHTAADRWTAATLGLAGALGAAALGELTRIGPLPTYWTAYLGGVGCQLAIALGAGETFAPRRPLLALGAAIALGAYPFLLPPRGTAALFGAANATTLGGAVALFAAARWLPARLRRPALAAAALLAALVLARAQWVTAALGAQEPIEVSME